MTHRSSPENELAMEMEAWSRNLAGRPWSPWGTDTRILLEKAAKALRGHAQCAPTDPLTDLVERFSKALLAKLRLAEANGRSGWDRDDWEKQCQEGLLRHVDKGDPRDVAAYCAFMWHHGWITALTSTQPPAQCAPMRAALEAFIKAYGSQDSFTEGLDKAKALAVSALTSHDAREPQNKARSNST